MPHRPERYDSGRNAAVQGIASEHLAVGLLMKKYGNVSKVNLPLLSYDVVLIRKMDGKDDLIRIQVKTAQNSIKFTGGTRGGVDRNYNIGENIPKEYKYSPETSDVIVGVHQNNDNSYSLFFFPTLLIEHFNQKSISINKVQGFKDNFEVLEKCKDENWVLSKAQEIHLL